MFFVVVSDCDVLLLLFTIGMRQGVEHVCANIIAVATFLEVRGFTTFQVSILQCILCVVCVTETLTGIPRRAGGVLSQMFSEFIHCDVAYGHRLRR